MQLLCRFCFLNLGVAWRARASTVGLDGVVGVMWACPVSVTFEPFQVLPRAWRREAMAVNEAEHATVTVRKLRREDQGKATKV